MPEDAWIADAVAQFGRSSKDKLAGPGDREAAIRSPLEALLGAAEDRLPVRARGCLASEGHSQFRRATG